jgi:glycosyltransferase involved in cell wall biosynthesis
VNKPFITIAIPFYNAEKYLSDAVRSVFAQTHQDWELILMDDGSTDKSLEIAESINDPRVRVYSDGKNKKLATRLNEITKLAKYDYIARMDADDIIHPERIERQLEVLAAKPEIDLVSTGLYSVTDDLKILGERWHIHTSLNHKDLLFKNGCGIVHASLIGKKDWFVRNRYDESLKLAQDYSLWLKASFKEDLNVYIIQEPLYYYREAGSVTAKKALLAYRYERKMYWRYGKNWKLVLIIKSLLKTIIVSIMNYIGKYDVVFSKRNKRMVTNTSEFNETIDLIKRTVVPVKT